MFRKRGFRNISKKIIQKSFSKRGKIVFSENGVQEEICRSAGGSCLPEMIQSSSLDTTLTQKYRKYISI